VIDGARETVNTARAGDYVARGAKGELYIIKPGVVAAPYGEPLTAPAAYRIEKMPLPRPTRQ